MNLGGYARPIDIPDRDLDAVVALLGPLDPDRFQEARSRIKALLEDYWSAQAQTAWAKPVSEDLKDLEKLAGVLNPDWLTERIRTAMNALEEFQFDNPVLHRRLQHLIRRQRIQEQIRAFADREEAIFAIGRDLSMYIEQLKRDVAEEDGRGRPEDFAALKLGHGLWQVWSTYTDRGTSPQNASDRPRFPFGDFVEAAGRLVDSEFKGHSLARKVHVARQSSSSGGK